MLVPTYWVLSDKTPVEEFFGYFTVVATGRAVLGVMTDAVQVVKLNAVLNPCRRYKWFNLHHTFAAWATERFDQEEACLCEAAKAH